MLKEYYLAHEGTGERVLVGYQVRAWIIWKNSAITDLRRRFSQSPAARNGLYQPFTIRCS